MSDKTKEGNKVQANPYNMSKSWHTPDVMPTELNNADSGLFVPNPASNRSEPEATAQESNPESSTENTAATMDKVQDSALNVETNPYNKVDYKKRYDDLKRYYDRKLGEWTSKENDLKTQLRENRPKYTPPKSKEELDAFKTEYPDIYGVVETVSHLQSANQMQTLQEEVESLKKRNQSLAQREAQLELGRLHPDFNDIKESDDFHSWADSQPMEIKSWIYENNSDGKLAARAIDLYKKDRGLGSDKKTETKTATQNQGADLLVKTREQVQVPQSNEVVFNRSDIANMSDEEFMQYEKDIVKAQREGRIK
ncbi:hypothetical protein HTVC103P_gp78 [Pelagibacter phage HTVC103P]|nr:hypothetical protein HTVC103P_gp78 [Pelagibacter phage HTVC103P]